MPPDFVILADQVLAFGSAKKQEQGRVPVGEDIPFYGVGVACPAQAQVGPEFPRV